MILAGFPIRKQFTFFESPSTILSTEILEGPQAKTFWPFLTAYTIAAQIVVVFPVPGGPCKRNIFYFRA